MIVGGLQPLSLIDYPGKTCAIIFTRGCNFRCRYCHNPELVIPEQFAMEVPLAKVYEFLERRRAKLQAVCVTGGEPTLHPDLLDMLRHIGDMGYLVKLDTNGSRPDVLDSVISDELVDYVAMDIKAPLTGYAKITTVPVRAEKIEMSIEIILRSGIDHEFRTTIARNLTSEEDLRNIARSIRGASNYFLQAFEPAKLVDDSFQTAASYSHAELTQLAMELEKYVRHCGLRPGTD